MDMYSKQIFQKVINDKLLQAFDFKESDVISI